MLKFNGVLGVSFTHIMLTRAPNASHVLATLAAGNTHAAKRLLSSMSILPSHVRGAKASKRGISGAMTAGGLRAAASGKKPAEATSAHTAPLPMATSREQAVWPLLTPEAARDRERLYGRWRFMAIWFGIINIGLGARVFNDNKAHKSEVDEYDFQLRQVKGTLSGGEATVARGVHTRVTEHVNAWLDLPPQQRSSKALLAAVDGVFADIFTAAAAAAVADDDVGVSGGDVVNGVSSGADATAVAIDTVTTSSYALPSTTLASSSSSTSSWSSWLSPSAWWSTSAGAVPSTPSPPSSSSVHTNGLVTASSTAASVAAPALAQAHMADDGAPKPKRKMMI
jgi:hypothetical protein